LLLTNTMLMPLNSVPGVVAVSMMSLSMPGIETSAIAGSGVAAVA